MSAFAVCVTVIASAGNQKPLAAPVNLNTATSEELQTVPGIRPAAAEQILLLRKNYGPFKSVDDLLAITGLGRKRLDEMRKYLTVGKVASSGQPATAAKLASPAKPNRAPKIFSPSADPACTSRL